MASLSAGRKERIYGEGNAFQFFDFVLYAESYALGLDEAEVCRRGG